MTNELPQGWASAPVAQIAEINPRHPKDLDDSMTVTFVPMAALSESKPGFQFTKKSTLGSVRKGFTHFADGDVLFAKITPCMENGKGAVAAGLRNGLGCGTTEVHVIRPLAGIPPHFLYYFLAQTKVRSLAKDSFTGTAGQSRVPTSFIEQLEVPIAPLSEQLRIVAKLEKLLPKVEECQERVARIPIVLRHFRQSVVAAACSGRLTVDWREKQTNTSIIGRLSDETHTLPSSWKAVCVGDVIENLKYGTSQKCSYARHGVPVLRIPNILNGVIDQTDLKYAQLPLRELEQLQLQVGDILLIRSNGSVSLVGKSALVRKQERGLAYAGYLIRLRPNRNLVESEFLNLAIGSFDVRLQIELEARSTSGVNNINSEEVRALRLSLPPLAEQKEIVRRVKGLFALADTIDGRYKEVRQLVDHLSHSVLAKAFRGELVPTEVELAQAEGRLFESAEELLERIEHSNGIGTSKERRRSHRAKRAAV